MCKFTEKKEKWNYLRFTIYDLLFILTFENELFAGKGEIPGKIGEKNNSHKIFA